MSLPSYLQDHDDDDDEDCDYIPGMDGEHEGFVDDSDESEEGEDDILPFLQGYLMVDPTDQRTIIYQDSNDENGSFCLKSKGEIPKEWSICSPLLPKPVCFLGWIGNPKNCLEFQVEVVEKDVVDSLDEKLLQAQHEKMKLEPVELNTKTVPTARETGKNQEQKEPAIVKIPPESTKQPPMLRSEPTAGDAKPVAYCITGTACHESQAITFRGVFCPAVCHERLSSSSLFVICTTKVEVDEEYGTAMVPTGGSGTVAVAKRKRGQDDSDNEDCARSRVCFDLQELIDIHEDMRNHQNKP